MEYTVKKLSKMSGVSTRTLRYYDEIGLLKPARVTSSKYRIYGEKEVDMLQQILFYRELSFSLEDIKRMLASEGYDRKAAFESHLFSLCSQRERLEKLIANVEKSLCAMKGETEMSDNEKFAGFAKQLVEENERMYGEEIRTKYGDEEVNAVHDRIKGMSKAQYDEAGRLEEELMKTLKAAFESGDFRSALALKACALHKEWLCVFYPNYSKQYHMGLAELYNADERFKQNYEKLGEGCTEFFRKAIYAFCGENA